MSCLSFVVRSIGGSIVIEDFRMCIFLFSLMSKVLLCSVVRII